MNYKKIYRKLNKYDIVSFDIFDTLLVRMAPNPVTVFEIVENMFSGRFSKKAFAIDRIKAEKTARSLTDKEEVTLNEIYANLSNYNAYEKEWLMNKELEVEKRILRINPIVKPIYDYCRTKNKKIVIQSDIYLDKSFIREVLQNNGIEYDYLAVSSDLKFTKRTGKMYENTLKVLKCNCGKVIHFGDSIKSDIVMARKNGIKAIRIKKLYYPNVSLDTITANMFDSLLRSKTQKSYDKYEEIGCRVLGPFYLSYSLWLMNELEKNDIKKVFFLSRDGFVMQKAFELINDKHIETKYLYVSRNSLVIPALSYCSEYEQVLKLTNISALKYIDVELFLRKIGLDPSECVQELKQVGLNKNDEIRGDEIYNNITLKQLYGLVQQKVLAHSNNQLRELLSYLTNIGFSDKVAIVDIGWQGTMQKALNIIMKAAGKQIDITGYYVGIKKSAIDFENGKMYGYCFDPNRNKLENAFFAFGGLFEYFYSNSEGSVKEYCEGKPKLEVNEYEGTEYINAMISIQNGGLHYLQEAAIYYDLYPGLDWKGYSLQKLIKYGIKPKLSDLKPFDKLYYSNIVNYYMLPQHGLLYYLIHIKQLKVDLNQSFWKVGFLKKLFKISLPYFQLYTLLKGR